MEREKIESIIESLLFVAGEPLAVKRLCELLYGVKKKEVQAALEELTRRWESPERGLRIVEVAGGFQFQTAEDNAAWVGKLIQSRPVRLSRASLECLAIIAYKQPVTRVEIDEIRGVDSGGVLKTLLENNFIKIAGRKDVPGKPLIYTTDKRFMEFFRLKTLAELPTLRELADIQEERLAEARARGEVPEEDSAGLVEGTESAEPEAMESGAGTDEAADAGDIEDGGVDEERDEDGSGDDEPSDDDEEEDYGDGEDNGDEDDGDEDNGGEDNGGDDEGDDDDDEGSGDDDDDAEGSGGDADEDDGEAGDSDE